MGNKTTLPILVAQGQGHRYVEVTQPTKRDSLLFLVGTGWGSTNRPRDGVLVLLAVIHGASAVLHSLQCYRLCLCGNLGERMRVLLLFLLSLATCTVAVAQGPEGKRSESKDVVTLKQLEQDWLDSYRDGDPDKMGKILADDFIGRWADGSTQTKDEQLKAIRTGAEKHSTNQMLECNVRLYGDTAVVTGLQTEQSVLLGRDGSGTYSYTDVFVKRDGRWQVVATETKRVASQTDSREGMRDRVTGTWQLMSAGTFRRDGSFEPFPEYGPNAIGYLMYDSTGHMCASLANPNHPHWVNAEKPTDAEKVRSYDAFFAYCGTYEIREKEGRIIHRPEMGSWPHYVGTDQNRNFRLEGNRLSLSAEETPPNGEHRRYQITWQRVSLPS